MADLSRNTHSVRHFSLAEREEIRVGLAGGASLRAVAAKLGRNVSSVSREVARNGGRDAYRAHVADERAWRTSRRPRDPKLLVTIGCAPWSRRSSS